MYHGRMISRTMEDYLKAIYQLAIERKKKVSTSALASKMECSAASVTNMLQRLSEWKLVTYRPYQGVELTDAGTRIALEMLRHHRLLELYLQEVLGYSWDKVHDEAEQLEHVISEEFEDRIDAALGYPTHDPHGHPIPAKDGTLPVQEDESLWDTDAGQTVCVLRVSDRNPEVLRYLATIGIYPQVELNVLTKAPFNGPVHVEVEEQGHSLSEELARQIFVVPAA